MTWIQSNRSWIHQTDHMISTEISNPKLQMGFLRNKTENPDTHLEQFETDIKKKYHVTCRDNLAEYLFRYIILIVQKHEIQYGLFRLFQVHRFMGYVIVEIEESLTSKGISFVKTFSTNISFLNHQHSLSRIFFACMFLVVLLLSIFFISSIWSKWQMSPIIISLR